ncbi:MAG: MutS family DNA mismatch repair protein [Rubripirellula sp.]|nr:MutS family DNA mismatch repair protein [Rubripirellula sp.]
MTKEEPEIATSATGAAGTDASAAMQRYQDQLKSLDERQEQLQATDRKFGKARVLLFFTALVFWLAGLGFDGVPYATWIGWAAMASFLIVVTANEPVRDRLEELLRHRSVTQRLISRLERDWDRLATKKLSKQLAEVELPGHRRDVASDLDLLGRASLFHLVSMAATRPGIRTLAHWLAGPADAPIAKERSSAVETLAPMREQRLRFYTLARQVGDSTGDPEHFVEWATGEPWLNRRRWLITWSHLSSILCVVAFLGLALGLLGVLPTAGTRASLIVLGVLIATNLGITAAMLGPAHAIFAIAMSNRQAVNHYQEIFASANWLPHPETDSKSGFLSRIRDAMIDGERSASEGMHELQRVARAGGLRQSAGTFLIYLPLQIFSLWDVRVLRRLEAWQATYTDRVPEWFQALGELESLVSIAALRDEYPSWVKPQWQSSSDPAVFEATAIGHPLLPDNARVPNSVQVGPPGTLLLVTGSNMSGKSTMLRSIGLNVALAGIGAPVCADRLVLPSAELATSIRVSDDVSEGVSFYMAELKRLKSVVDHAREMAARDDRVCIFLLDEILQGTNSRERQIAVVQVLRHLVNSQAIGAISTHDLELADEPELLSIASTVHFRETIQRDEAGDDQMIFDYKMRLGVSPTTNALRLLEMVGLGEQQDEHSKQ